MGEDRTDEPQTTHERLTVAQAAAALGITEGAVRSRIKRGTLPTTKEGGTVFILWGGGTSQANQTPNTSVPADQFALVEALQDQVRYLREQLDAEREARTEERRRHDTHPHGTAYEQDPGHRIPGITRAARIPRDDRGRATGAWTRPRCRRPSGVRTAPVVEESVWGMSEPEERGQEDLARAMAELNVPATDYALAYRTLHRAKKESNVDEETFSWAVSCMRELVAHCELYLRDNPQDREIIELIIDRILEEREER